ncbi:MAG TPA: long-chain fatty acid--CoA ligase [Jatrophihabitantaceae bacterium]|jgi:fatty-acyl-CoA synthase|nr:long-chain fatty acid--CoA ligase [Jatrophihabitantaceae bacterium]
MQGLMQDAPLTTNWIFDRGGRYFSGSTIVTNTATGLQPATFADVRDDARRIAAALDALGVSDDGRVATFAWNSARHLALYFAIPGTGRVMHTANIRYFPDQLAYTINHAEDEVVFVDRSLLPLLAKNLAEFKTVQHVVVMDDGADCELPDDSRIVSYAEVVDGTEPVDFSDRVTDEHRGAAICYTTGTTGNPKGVFYSHRSMWLHSNAALSMSTFGLRESDRILPVVPMFHANAWGLPYAAFMAGASFVMPGPDLTPRTLLGLMAAQHVTVAAGVPTIWMGMVPMLDEHDLSSLRTIICGGSAVPKVLSEAWRSAVGIPITQAWGMTETSPIASVWIERPAIADRSEDEKADLRATVGIAPPGVEVRIVDADSREELPWDDEASGELECRGPWVARQYYRTEEPGEQFTPDGWLRTGDVAAISPLGYIRLVDRTKDLIKSGGEWISSVALENEIMSHPKVAEAAVIAVTHPKWAERPLACVVLKDGEEPGDTTKAELLDYLAERLGKWQLPDDIVFIDEVPKTSVGKFSKKTLRDRFADYVLPSPT